MLCVIDEHVNSKSNSGGSETVALNQNQLPAHTHNGPGGATSSTGGGQVHSNLMPYLVLNYVIALQGQYSSKKIVSPRIGSSPRIGGIGLGGWNFAPHNMAFLNGILFKARKFVVV